MEIKLDNRNYYHIMNDLKIDFVLVQKNLDILFSRLEEKNIWKNQSKIYNCFVTEKKTRDFVGICKNRRI